MFLARQATLRAEVRSRKPEITRQNTTTLQWMGVPSTQYKRKTLTSDLWLPTSAHVSSHHHPDRRPQPKPHAGKTAASVIRYRGHEVAALLDATQAGKTSGELPRRRQLCRSSPGSTMCRTPITLLLGIAPPGGKIPASWRAIILDAIARRKMDVISGLHDFVGDDPEFAAAAKKTGVKIHDIRKKHGEKRSLAAKGCGPIACECTRSGMIAQSARWSSSIRVDQRPENRRGYDAKFIATGAGPASWVEGDGLPLDCVVADFVSGGAEKLILQKPASRQLC